MNNENTQAVSSWKTIIGTYLQSNLTGKARAYSSRNMYGEYCLAFVYDTFNSYLCDCIDLIVNFDNDNADNLTIDRLRLILTSSSQDNIGRSRLVFYFPTLKFDIALSSNAGGNNEDEENDGE